MMARIILAVALLSIAPAPPPGGEQGGGRAPVREIQFGDYGGLLGPVRLPFYLPTWAEKDPLSTVGARLGADDRVGAADLLARLLAAREGRLLLPPGGVPRRGRVVRIGPPGEIFREWLATSAAWGNWLPMAPEDAPDVSLPLDSTSPLLWHPEALERARRRLEEALEAGRFPEAWLLLTRRGLREGLAPPLRRWLEESRLGRSPSGPWRSGFPGQEASSPSRPAEPRSLRLLYRISLPFRPTPLDPGSRHLAKRIGTRRTPLGAIYPLVGPDSLLLATGAEVFELSTHPPFLRCWEIRGDEVGASGSHPELLVVPVRPAASGETLAISFRTPRKEHRSTMNVLFDPPPLKDSGWSRIVLLGGAAPREEPLPLRWQMELWREGYTSLGPPRIDGDRIIIAAARGWREVELVLFAFAMGDGSLIWRRHLGTVPRHWHSNSDLRGVVPEATIVTHGGDLIVVHGAGWLARVAADSGEYRGAIIYSRYSLDRLPHPSAPTLAGDRFRVLPAPRPRYSGPPLVLPAAPEGRAALIVLPPDARELLAVDLERWQILWTHPVKPQTRLLGAHAGRLLLLDAGIPAGKKTLDLRSIDATTGRVLEDGWQTLEVAGEPQEPAPARRGDRGSRGSPRGSGVGGEPPQDTRLAPLLTGVPRLVGDALWVPGTGGLEIWTLPRRGGGPPDRVLPWPRTSRGGTPIPLGEGRIALLRRGDEGLKSSSALEILEME
ncbi:MAG: hypothetical protein ACE5GW_11290 [Planctomycetota bacterium]